MLSSRCSTAAAMHGMPPPYTQTPPHKCAPHIQPPRPHLPCGVCTALTVPHTAPHTQPPRHPSQRASLGLRRVVGIGAVRRLPLVQRVARHHLDRCQLPPALASQDGLAGCCAQAGGGAAAAPGAGL